MLTVSFRDHSNSFGFYSTRPRSRGFLEDGAWSRRESGARLGLDRQLALEYRRQRDFTRPRSRTLALTSHLIGRLRGVFQYPKPQDQRCRPVSDRQSGATIIGPCRFGIGVSHLGIGTGEAAWHLVLRGPRNTGSLFQSFY